VTGKPRLTPPVRSVSLDQGPGRGGLGQRGTGHLLTQDRSTTGDLGRLLKAAERDMGVLVYAGLSLAEDMAPQKGSRKREIRAWFDGCTLVRPGLAAPAC
jgi:hypothetical protein